MYLFEPFQIPSGSMKPTLLVGDFILVQKFAYGLKDPVMHSDSDCDWENQSEAILLCFDIHRILQLIILNRVVGLPGDIIRYSNEKQLCIQPKNETECKIVSETNVKKSNLGINGTPLLQFDEQLGSVKHQILINPWRPVNSQDYQPRPGVSEWIVPEGHYFMMGDNRDNSADSRYWGFVPEANLVGKAVAIWISFEFNRSPDSLLPSWIPTNVRFNRIGRIH
ncbi:signal peptidase I [Vibrio sp. PP-XX7]